MAVAVAAAVHRTALGGGSVPGASSQSPAALGRLPCPVHCSITTQRDSLCLGSGLGQGSRSLSGSSSRRRPTARQGVAQRVYAIDAAQPFDMEARLARAVKAEARLKIGIVGFGNFGQFLAKRFKSHGHELIATSRGDYSAVAGELGVKFFSDLDDFCEYHPDVVIMSTSIISTEAALGKLPLQRLKRSTLFVDVLSVKEFPKRLFLNQLPVHFDILCTHPMFGPDSGRGTWEGLPLMYERVRVSEGKPRRKAVADGLLEVFRREGCRMVEMSCEEHDRQAASTQFITHTVGRMLGEMGLSNTAIDTKGYESLLSLVNNTANDSFDLYYGLFMYNQSATQELQRLETAFDRIRQKLMDELHDALRKDIFGPKPITPEVLPPSKRLSDSSSAQSLNNGGGAKGSVKGSTAPNQQQ